MDVRASAGQVVIGGPVTSSNINGVNVGGGGPQGPQPDRVTLGESAPAAESSWKSMLKLFGKGGSEPKINLENGGVAVPGDLVGKTITVGPNGVVIQ